MDDVKRHLYLLSGMTSFSKWTQWLWCCNPQSGGEKYECQEQVYEEKRAASLTSYSPFFYALHVFCGFYPFRASESGENFACGWNFGVEGAGTDPHRRLDFPVSDVAFEHTKDIPTSCGRLYIGGGDVPNHLHACCYRQVFIYLQQLMACSFQSWASRTDVLNEHSLPPPKR